MIDLTKRPPLELLKEHNALVPGDTVFLSWCRLKQSLFRQTRGWECGKGGTPPREIGSYLAEDNAKEDRNFLNGGIWLEAQKRLREREPHDVIERGRLLHNMLTSQTLCLNLFLPQRSDLRLATAIWSAILPEYVGEVTAVKLEHSPGRGHPTLGTGDHSAFDAFVEYVHRDGSLGFLAIETKYTEPFSPVGKRPTQRQDHLVKATCLYSESGWSKLNDFARSPVGNRRPEKFMPTQQLWRTHLLAETMRSARYRHVMYVVLHADGDQECARLLPRYRQTLTHHRKPEHLFQAVTLEAIFRKIRPTVPATASAWIEQFWERYLDWSPVQTKLAAFQNGKQ